jgi:hypothetical protein
MNNKLKIIQQSTINLMNFILRILLLYSNKSITKYTLKVI